MTKTKLRNVSFCLRPNAKKGRYKFCQCIFVFCFRNFTCIIPFFGLKYYNNTSCINDSNNINDVNQKSKLWK